jgi:hypothetical protein
VEIRRCGALLAVLALVGCGTSHRRQPAGEWPTGAAVVIKQLRGDILAVVGADRVPAARRALTDESQLYGLLIAFSDVAGCRHMVSSLGTRPGQFAPANRLLTRACRPLQRAATLFTRATTRTDPRALVAAVHQAAAALAPLDRATLALGRVRPAGQG